MNQQIGSIGEQLAVKYLMDHGYSILDRNYRTKLGELDIIAKKDRVISFIEVKTRTTNTFGMPSEAVDYKKQNRIQRLSQQYILHKNLPSEIFTYRFDVMEVKIINKKYKINHIIHAF